MTLFRNLLAMPAPDATANSFAVSILRFAKVVKLLPAHRQASGYCSWAFQPSACCQRCQTIACQAGQLAGLHLQSTSMQLSAPEDEIM